MNSNVTDTAARQASTGHPAQVDLTPDAITDPGFLEEVITSVRRHHAPPRLITFAFPASQLHRSRRLVDRLAACGFTLAITDDQASGAAAPA